MLDLDNMTMAELFGPATAVTLREPPQPPAYVHKKPKAKASLAARISTIIAEVNARHGAPTRTEALAALAYLKEFIGRSQHATLTGLVKCGEERDFFREKMCALAALIKAMPVTYQSEALKDPLVVLHYFAGGQANWYLYEKDMGDVKEPGQHQAFGLADLFQDGGELGYISIVELLANGAELDLYFTPVPLSVIRAKGGDKNAITKSKESHGSQPVAEPGARSAFQLELDEKSRFHDGLATLLEQIKVKASEQMTYNLTTNVPQGTLKLDECADNAIESGYIAAMSQRNHWDCEEAVRIAHDTLQDNNCPETSLLAPS